MKLKAKTFFLPLDLIERLRTAAFLGRRTQAEIVRDAIDTYLDEEDTDEE